MKIATAFMRLRVGGVTEQLIRLRESGDGGDS